MIKESRSKRKSKPKTRPSSGKKTKSSCFCREPHFLCLGYGQSPSSVLISKAAPFETKTEKEMSCFTGFGNETAHARVAIFIAWASHR